MRIATEIRRPLGTMIAYGFARGDVAVDLDIAARLGAQVVEVLPDWKSYPDPIIVRNRVADRGLSIHSAHGCWGGRSIRANRVDLGSSDPETHSASIDDLKRCIDWLETAGGSCLVVHPGGFSLVEDAEPRGEALASGLRSLADHARGTGVTLCVENMPPGVHPGSLMDELFVIVNRIDRPEIALALDTGHAHISADVLNETHAAGPRLLTTHVHDNDGRKDVHLPPGSGSIGWEDWLDSLDAIDYRGPILLECIRHLREVPESLDEALLVRLRRLTGIDR